MSTADQRPRPGDSDPSGDELLHRVRNPRTPQPRTLASYADGDTATIHGQITGIDPRITHQENPWAVITIAGQGGSATVGVLPREYPQFRDLLRDGASVTVDGFVGRYRNQPVMRATSIQAADGGR